MKPFSRTAPVVILASAPWQTSARVNCHHIAERLAARGHPVLFAESAGLRSPSLVSSRHDRTRSLRRIGGWLRGPRRVRDDLFVLSPLILPWGLPEPGRSWSQRWLAAQLRHAVRALGFGRPVVWTMLPSYASAARALEARVRVYHCVDDHASNPGVDRAWVARLEQQVVEEADLVFAASPVLAERLSSMRSDTRLLANVADAGLFGRAVRQAGREPAELSSLSRPRVVYMGNIASYKVDFGLLRSAARTLPWTEFVLVGDIGLGDASGGSGSEQDLLREPNVTHLPARPQAELPDLLRHCDVGLVPFCRNGHTLSSLPLKLWEYLAAGLPVVAMDLPNLRGLAPTWAIQLARDAQEFPMRIEKALLESSWPRREERLALAMQHDWGARIDEISDALDGFLRR